jgi:diacylglycerol kinase family enzyme
MSPKYAVILNAKSGRGKAQAASAVLERILAEKGIPADITMDPDWAPLERAVRRALDGGCTTICAGGGDGTVSGVAGALAGSEVALGVLPLGTLNHFAKDLKIPLDLEGAAATLLQGFTARVDAASVNGRVFINNSSLGIYPQMVRERIQLQRFGDNKLVAAIRASIAVLRRWPLVTVRLQADGHSITLTTPFVFVGNNEYEVGAPATGTRSSLDRGLLSVLATNRAGRLDLLRMAVQLLLGGSGSSTELKAHNTAEVLVESRRRVVRVSADGEVAMMATPLRYAILPGALRVIVPRPEETQQVPRAEPSSAPNCAGPA